MSIVLTRKEMEELTGKRRPADQIKWLKKQAWAYVVGGDGYPKVATALFDFYMGVTAVGAQSAHPRLRFPDDDYSRPEVCL